MITDPSAPTQDADHPEQALARAVAHGQQGQGVQALSALQQALDWGIDRQRLSQALVNGTLGDLSRATAFYAPDSRQLATREHQAFDSLALIRRSLAADSVARTRHATGFRRAAVSAPHTRSPNPEPSASQPALFHCRVEVDGQTHWLAFNTANLEHYHLEDGLLQFKLPPGKPGYLVSNETGDFNIAPSDNPLPLAPATIYKFNARINSVYGDQIVVWLFQYTKSGDIQKRSFVMKADGVEGIFQTSTDYNDAAIGIRVFGEGKIPACQLSFAFASGLHANKENCKAIAQEKQKIARIGDFVNLRDHFKFDKKKVGVKVFGTFRSGTNYLRALLEWNTCSEVIFSSIGGWKHGLITDTNRKEIEEHELKCVCVVKDPFASLVSWFEYFCKIGLNMSCSRVWNNFLRERFVIFDSGKDSGRNQYRFSNPVDYWNALNWNLSNFCANNPVNAILIKYEDLLDSPALTVKNISEQFALPILFDEQKFIFVNKTLTRMGDAPRATYEDYLEKEVFDSSKYTEKTYLSRFSEEQLDFVSSLLDVDLMVKFRYGNPGAAT